MRTALLILDVVFLILAFGLRTVVQWRRTGDGGWRLGRPHSVAEALARLAIAAGAILAFAGLAFDQTAAVGAPVGVLGVAVAVAGVALTTVAQLGMGSSWRIGVDPGERTDLVQDGLYAWMRNPIYTGMALFTVGQAAAWPNDVTVAAAVIMVAGVQLQVRAVEEPYLDRTHGAAHRAWASATGRFLPGIGRLG